MRKGIFLRRKSLVKIIIIPTAFFVAIALISSSSLSVTLSSISETKNFNFEAVEEETPIGVESSIGLASKSILKNPFLETSVFNNYDMMTNAADNFEDVMYGYVASDPSGQLPEGPCYFPLDDPDAITSLGETSSSNFIAGSTWTYDERWLGCEYGSGVLWEIDPETGDMTSLGGGGISCNGLSWDPVYSRLYGATDTALYEYDPYGEQEYIGPFNADVNTMIGIAFDIEGTLYGWDLGDKLWIIDTESGQATEVGPLGINLTASSDGDISFDSNQMFLTAYTTLGQLYYCDKETGECTLIDNFQGGAQITGSMFKNIYFCCEHDVGVKSINYPKSGYAGENMSMQATVKNHGNNTETIDVQMQVNNGEPGPIILEEDFSGDTFPPEGWTTDWWEQSNTNYACGEPPEARCNKYTQANQGDYYDNYIMTPALNCSDVEKVTLNFKLTIDTFYNNYVSFYIKIRGDSNSTWKDITPWDNPISWDITCETFEIGIYGFGEPIGEEFQIKWEFIGYYYYFNNFYLDNVMIRVVNTSYEYAEIVEDVTISPGEEVNVDFPTWTPTDWQDPEYEDTFQEYLVEACTFLDGDHNPQNDCKYKQIDLYFPWLHDIEVTSIDSPCEYGPGKTYPVEATIKNVGQYAECCIPIDIMIGELEIFNTLLTEESWITVPPTGWTDEHKNYGNNYGWNKSYSSNSGGSSPEAYLPYNHALADYVFYSFVFDTSDYPVCKLDFLSYINHYSGSGLYTLEAGYSYDGETWYAAWSRTPNNSQRYIVSVPFMGGSETTYIGFWVKGNPNYFSYWYIDNVEVKVFGLTEEYNDHMCQGDELEPGETRTFEFDDWTPDFLQYEITGSKYYMIQTEIDMEGDKNPCNDIASEYFTLDYWHDVGIKEITSPIGPGGGGSTEEWLHFDDGTTVNALSPCGGPFEYAIRLTPDELGDWAGYQISVVKRHHGWNTPFWMSGKIKIYEEGTSSSPGDLISEEPFECFEADWHDIELSEPVDITGDEDIWVSVETIDYATGSYPAAMDPALNYPGKGNWVSLGSGWNQVSIYGFYCDWNIAAGVGSSTISPDCYIQPGTEAIKATVENLGTFPELDLTCYAEIYEYITDPENGTLVYEDNITDIDLEEPVGGTLLLSFDDYTFIDEGVFGLYLDLPLGIDDYPESNQEELIIGVDDTKPFSWHILDPPYPTGLEGWYVCDVEVTLYASDPVSAEVASGVKEIRYTIDGGSEQIIPGSTGTFVIHDDGEDILIEYWAIDNVGNVESIKSFFINMDQTVPVIGVVEWDSYKEGGTWYVKFTCDASDAMSGMDRVEMFIDDELYETNSGPGPSYEFVIEWSSEFKNSIFKFVAFDKAGNSDFDELDGSDIQSASRILNFIHHSSNMLFLRLLDRFPFFLYLLEVLGWYAK